MSNKITLGEIINELNEMGFISETTVLETMTLSEVKKFYRKAKKVYKMAMELEAEIKKRTEMTAVAEG